RWLWRQHGATHSNAFNHLVLVEGGVRRDRLEGPRAAPWPAGPPARFGLRPCARFLGTGLRAVGTVPGSWPRHLVGTWPCWMPSAYRWCPRESDACHNCSIGKAATADRPNSLHNTRNASGGSPRTSSKHARRRLPARSPRNKWGFFDGSFRLNHKALQSI